MCNMIRVCLVCLLMLLIVSGAEAQVNPVYQKMLQNGWRYPFENGFRKLTPAELDTQYCKALGYDDTAVANLKKIGVDIMGRRTNRDWDQKMWTALSDCIIIGTVSRIDHPSWIRPWYHTVAYVQVEEFLRNDYGLPKGEVGVLEVSGPTGRQPGEMVTQVGENTLSIGEHVLLFLGASSLITFAADNKLHDLYNHLINDTTISFQPLAEYEMKSGELLSKERVKSLSGIRDDVTSVLDAIKR